MTKFEFIKQNPEEIKKNLINRTAQKLKTFLKEEGKINPLVKFKLDKYFKKNKELKETNITKEEIINAALNLIKKENDGILPENLENIKAA